MDNVNYDALVSLVPEPYKSVILLCLQLAAAALAFTTTVLPILEKIAAKTTTKRDDAAVSSVAKILSMIPRVQIPAVSQRPPAPAPAPVVLEVTSWPKTDPSTGAPASTVIVPPSDVDPSASKEKAT